MSEQIRPSTHDEPEPPPASLPGPAAAAAQRSSDGELDDLLAEIDSVLETNAEEFVRSFVQKGGQ